MILGPGLITGASDDDPSGIGTYTQAGASLGLATLWTAVITLPMMAAIQLICAKIGMVSGMGLSGRAAQILSTLAGCQRTGGARRRQYD
jgi:Mn2+/Fe2+ NRAMP family transporter